MSSARPTLSLTRKTPLKSKKATTNGVKKKNTAKPWVDTVNDLGQYKPSKVELESRKVQRKSNNKILAKVALNDKRALNDPDRQRFIEQQVMRDIQRQPSQNVEAILARSEHVMGICQRILCGDLANPVTVPQGPQTPPRGGVPQYQQVNPRLPHQGGSAYSASLSPQSPPGQPLSPASSFTSLEYEDQRLDSFNVEEVNLVGSNPEKAKLKTTVPSPVSPTFTPAHALGEVTAELLLTVRELREELLQEREARERLQHEVLQQRQLLSELAREVLRLQINCSTGGVALAATATGANPLRGKAERGKKGVAVMEKEEGFVALAPPKQVDNSFGRR